LTKSIQKFEHLNSSQLVSQLDGLSLAVRLNYFVENSKRLFYIIKKKQKLLT